MDTEVVRTSRVNWAIIMVASLVLIWPFTLGHLWVHLFPVMLILSPMGLIAIVMCAKAALQLIRPDEVVISSEGVQVRDRQGTRDWPWSEIGHIVGGKRVALFLRQVEGRTRRVLLPYGCPMGLLWRLQRAHSLYGKPTPPAPKFDRAGLFVALMPVGLMFFYLIFLPLKARETREIVAALERRCPGLVRPPLVPITRWKYIYRYGGCPADYEGRRVP